MLNYLVHFSFRELHRDVTFRQTTSISDGFSRKPGGMHPVEKVFLPENKQYWQVIVERYESIRKYLLSERQNKNGRMSKQTIESQLTKVSGALNDVKERAQRGYGIVSVRDLPELNTKLIDYYLRVGDWVYEHQANTQLQEAAFKNIQGVLRELCITGIESDTTSLRESLGAKSIKMLVASIATSVDERQALIADQATRMFSLQMSRRYQITASAAPMYK
tara:strand:+ start:1557 stop:2216 length:660 start_codon:yes stop_codon:yes gene_type:complete